MRIKVNGKIFTADSQEKNRIKIENDIDDFDILFFKKWMNKTFKNSKKDYVEDIDFISKINSGTFLSCFPVELGEDYVVVAYDGILII